SVRRVEKWNSEVRKGAEAASGVVRPTPVNGADGLVTGAVSPCRNVTAMRSDASGCLPRRLHGALQHGIEVGEQLLREAFLVEPQCLPSCCCRREFVGLLIEFCHCLCQATRCLLLEP